MNILKPGKNKWDKPFTRRPSRNKSLSSPIVINGGFWTFKAVKGGLLSSVEIEASRKLLSKFLKKKGLVILRVFPNVPFTKKPAEIRMGKGKGPVSSWGYFFKPGESLFDISKVPSKEALAILKVFNSRLSIKFRLSKR